MLLHPEDRQNGAEGLLLSHCHLFCDICQHRGLEELSIQSLTRSALPSAEDLGTLSHRIIYEPLVVLQAGWMHAGPAVDPRPIGPQGRALAQLSHQPSNLLAEAVVNALVHDEPLRPSAVLAHVLEGSSHHQLRQGLVDLGVLTDHKGVLASKLQDHRGQDFCLAGGFHDLAAHCHAPHEDHLVALLHKRTACLCIARGQLHQVLWGPRSLQAGAECPTQVVRRPGGELRDLDHDRVPGEDRCDHGVENIVKRIVPRHNGSNDSHWHPFHTTCLMQVHEPGVPKFRTQIFLTVCGGPTKLLQGHSELTHHGVKNGLTRVTTCNSADGVHVL
mmetsp:Transcript_48017/g.107779  ORF Transcript_48017/g.107779 Transcript_48017/m.107779 type:complete len:331 (-) Transcript_48017:482-1474(-)